MSRITDIADAIVAALNAETFSLPFTSARFYRPIYEIKDLKTLQVTVVPRGDESEDASRSEVQHDIQVDIAVQIHVADMELATLDPYMDLVEEIVDFIQVTRAFGVGSWMKTENRPIFRPRAPKRTADVYEHHNSDAEDVGMIGARMKSLFFDTTKVKSMISRTTRRLLGKFGAFTRAVARRSIPSLAKRGGRASRPGQTPTSRTGLLKDFIFYAYSPQAQNVVIGPEKLSGGTDAPETLEEGGWAVVTRGSRQSGFRKERVFIEARPYMGPAHERAMERLPVLWQQSIKK